MSGSGGTTRYDPETVRAKYLAERDRRLVPGRTDIRDLRADDRFARYGEDPFTPVAERAPVVDDEVDAVIVGGGIAGILAGVNLRKAGVERIRIVDRAGGELAQALQQAVAQVIARHALAGDADHAEFVGQ